MALYRHAYCGRWEDTTVRFQATMMCCTVGDHTSRALSLSPTPFSLQTRSEGSALRLEHGLPRARVRFHRQWSDWRGPGRSEARVCGRFYVLRPDRRMLGASSLVATAAASLSRRLIQNATLSRTLGSKASTRVDLDSLPPPPPPLARPGLTDEEHAGRDLAKLALIAQSMRDAIAAAGSRGEFTPDLLVDYEAVANESLRLVTDALDASGRPCTPEQLADRVNRDIVSVSAKAMDYRTLLRVGELRDDLERFMVSINVLPPAEALIDGAGQPFSRLDRRALRRLEAGEAASSLPGTMSSISSDGRLKPKSRLPVVSPGEIARRRAELEASAEIENVLYGFDTALLEVSRVNKVTRGGTTMSMRALVAIGNRAGTAGYGEGKSDTVAHAIERACRDAKRNLLYIDRYNDRTLYHRGVGQYVCSRVTLWPAPPGRGISANNNFNAIFQLFGLKDIGAKLHGPRSKANAVKALFNGLSRIRSAEDIATTRGLRVATSRESPRDAMGRVRRS
jgi:small subunit ribosomal protein S5